MHRRALLVAALAAVACSGDGPSAIAPSCENAEEQRQHAAALDLEIGEVLELCDPEAMAGIRLPGGTSPREFLVVVANVAAMADQLERLSIRWAGSGAIVDEGIVGTSLTNTLPAAPPDARIRAAEASLPGPAHAAQLWRGVRERREREPRARASLGSVAPIPGAELAVRVPNADATSLCFDYTTVTARVRAVGESVVILEDTAAPPEGFGDADYAALAAEFDGLHAQVARTYFGELPDIDGDGRVHLLVTPEVNRLSVGSSSSFVAGFFFGGDLLPRFDDALWPLCLQSNEGEILYLIAPDPGGRFGIRRTADEVRRQIRGTTAHELQHMVNFGVRMRGGADTETVWLNEAMSHLAEELTGRQRRGLGDFQQVGTSDLTDATTGLRDYQAFFLQNLLRYRSWLSRPDTTSPTSDAVRAQLAPRGAAWALLRHVADHHAGDDLPALLRKVTAGPRAGAANLGEATGAPFESLLSAWLVANFADDLSLPALDDRYRYRSWRMRSAVAEAIGSTPTPGGAYPLRITMLDDNGAVVTLTARSGSGAYYGVRDASTAGGGLLSLRSPQGEPIPLSGARLLVMRVR